jgi:hypothetical protein
MKKIYLMITMIMLLFSGCIKDTYNMDKLSDKMVLSPDFSVSAFKGDVTFSKLVKQSDTVLYDQDKFVRLIFRKDSIINFQLNDLYNLQDMVTYSHDYVVGELTISPFQGSASFKLNDIVNSGGFPPALKTQITAYDDGGLHIFPPLPAVNIGEKTLSAFANISQVTFASGNIDITITNNLTAPLSGLSLNLYKGTDHSLIFGSVPVPEVLPGQTKTVTLSLAGKTISNTIIAGVSITGSNGSTPSSVLISLNNSGVQIGVAGNNLKVRSGRVILPQQAIATNDTRDVISFDPGLGIELSKLKMNTGNLNYKILASTGLNASLDLTLPTILRSGVAVHQVVNVSPGVGSQGMISFNNTEIDLGTDLVQPFNRVPFIYSMQVSSNNLFVDINSTDKVHLELTLPDPGLDYVKGYFGQKVENLDSESIDLGIDDLLNKLTGGFLISNPIIRLNYSNSFAIPIEVALNGEGKRGDQSVNLALAPFSISHPSSLNARDVSALFVIDKNNSSLPQLISLPPGQINFSGSVKMNPSGDPDHLRDNYIFGNSRFLGNLEVEMPLEFRLNNLQLADTIDNFLKESDNFGGMNKLQLKMKVKNGFPLGASFTLTVHDTHLGRKSTINAASILGPAPVDNNGKVTGTTDTETTIDLTDEFLKLAKTADQMIFSFTLVTTGNGTKDVKIYSDYGIGFNAAIIVKPEIELK